jgi:MFS family permease
MIWTRTTSTVTTMNHPSALGLVSGPFWGWLSDRVGRRRIAIFGALGITAFVWPFFWFLDHGRLGILPLVLIVGMNVLHDSIYGPQAAWFAEQFPLHLRYTGVSFGYQVGTVLSGGLTPFIAAALLKVGGDEPLLICAYLAFLGLLSTAAALAARDPERPLPSATS